GPAEQRKTEIKRALDYQEAAAAKKQLDEVLAKLKELPAVKDAEGVKDAVAALELALKSLEGGDVQLKSARDLVKAAGYDERDVPAAIAKMDKVLAAVADALKAKREELPALVRKLGEQQAKLAAALERLKKEEIEVKGDNAEAGIVDLAAKLKKETEKEAKERQRLQGRVKATLERLAVAKFVDPGEKDDRLNEAVASVIKKAETPIITTQNPSQMLDMWAALLEDPDRKGGVVSSQALQDAEAVARTSQGATKLKAEYVVAVALRNQLDFARARRELEAVVPPAE